MSTVQSHCYLNSGKKKQKTNAETENRPVVARGRRLEPGWGWSGRNGLKGPKGTTPKVLGI